MGQIQYQNISRHSGGIGHVRRVERLQNGFWRADWSSGLVSLYEHDPRPSFIRHYEPARRYGCVER